MAARSFPHLIVASLLIARHAWKWPVHLGPCRLGPLDFPRVQGGDVAGVVRAGDPETADLVGSPVLVDPADYDGPGPDARPADVVGGERDGGFAEYVVGS